MHADARRCTQVHVDTRRYTSIHADTRQKKQNETKQKHSHAVPTKHSFIVRRAILFATSYYKVDEIPHKKTFATPE